MNDTYINITLPICLSLWLMAYAMIEIFGRLVKPTEKAHINIEKGYA